MQELLKTTSLIEKYSINHKNKHTSHDLIRSYMERHGFEYIGHGLVSDNQVLSHYSCNPYISDEPLNETEVQHYINDSGRDLTVNNMEKIILTLADSTTNIEDAFDLYHSLRGYHGNTQNKW